MDKFGSGGREEFDFNHVADAVGGLGAIPSAAPKSTSCLFGNPTTGLSTASLSPDDGQRKAAQGRARARACFSSLSSPPTSAGRRKSETSNGHSRLVSSSSSSAAAEFPLRADRAGPGRATRLERDGGGGGRRPLQRARRRGRGGSPRRGTSPAPSPS